MLINRSRSVSAGLIVVLTILMGGVTAASIGLDDKKRLGKAKKIKRYGYSIRPIKEWQGVPAKPGEKRIVGGWLPDTSKAEKRGLFKELLEMNAAGLTIVRFPRKTSTTGAGQDDDEDEDDTPTFRVSGGRVRLGKEPTTLDEYIEDRFEGASKRYVKKKIVAGRGKKKLTGRLMEFTYGAQAICIAAFEKDQFEWGVIYTSREDYYGKWKKIFHKSIKTFSLFPAVGGPITIAAGVDKSKLTPEQRRAQIKAGIASSSDWYAIDTKNYVFLSNSDKKSFIKKLAREIEVVRAKVYEKLFAPTKEVTAICIVRVFGDESEYYRYGGPRGSAGYWDSSKEELVLFDNFQGETKKNSKAYTKAVMYHEAFHQYIYYAIGDLAPHSWFNEGHGDYFAGMAVSGRSIRVKLFEWRIKYLKQAERLDMGLIPIRSLIRLPQSEYYSNAGLKYSQGWALIYFLRNVTKNKRWKKIPDIYFAHLRDNIAAFKKSKEEDDASGEAVEGIPGVKRYSFEDADRVQDILDAAVDKGFEGVDIDDLDKAFKKWVKGIL